MVLREEKKRKTSGASTSREEATQTNDDEAPTLPHEETQPPSPPPTRNIWTSVNNLTTRVDHIELGMDEMRMNQKVLIGDIGAHFGFSLMAILSTTHGHLICSTKCTRRR